MDSNDLEEVRNFKENLKFGQLAESRIGMWLRKRGNTILPIYEKIIDDKKGPRLFTPQSELIAPDLLIFKTDRIIWVEAKHKNAFTWHRISQRYVTGMDLHHYQHYCEIADNYPYEIWLLFLHDGGQAKDSPPNSPSGLFGNEIAYLKENENHRHGNWGKGGMVYWALEHLKKLAKIEEI